MLKFKLPKIVEGLLWAVIGGAATSALELQKYLTQWKEYGIDWSHMAGLASVGGIMGGAMFLRDQAKRREIADIAQQAAEAIAAANSGVGLMGSGAPGMMGGAPPPGQPGG